MLWKLLLQMASLESATIGTLPPLRPGFSRLYLCRHGETDSNARRLLQGSGVDSPLTETGREQALRLARMLRSVRLGTVASSTLCRAVETADIVAGQQQAAVQRSQDKALEEMFYGDLEGVPIDDAKPQLAELTEAWAAGRTDVPVGGGESPDALLARARLALFGGGDGRAGLLGSESAGRHVAVVAHSTLNQAVIADAGSGGGLRSMLSVKQANACVNVIDYSVSDGTVDVVAINIKPEDVGQ